MNIVETIVTKLIILFIARYTLWGNILKTFTQMRAHNSRFMYQVYARKKKIYSRTIKIIKKLNWA